MPCWKNLPEKFIEKIALIVPDRKQKSILETFCATKPISIRINTIKTSKQQVINNLKVNNILTEEVPWYSDALIIKSTDKRKLSELDIYKKGHFYIQSLSSMLPVLVLNPLQGERVLDIAAAPGSKTTQIAQMMNNSGEIIANDISPKRLYKLKSILDIQGVKNVKITQIPGEFIYKKYPNYFDKVLLDAPCTMEGRFESSDPKSYKDWSLKKIKVLSYLQKKILRSAFFATKPGGSIVYSTCTISPEENEEVINSLILQEDSYLNLEKPDLTFDYPLKEWKNNKFHKDIIKTVRIYPTKTMEAFFLAKIKRMT